MNTIQTATQKRILELMNSKGWTVSELARQANLSQSTVNYIVKAGVKNPSTQAIYQIALAFDLTLSQFYDSDLFLTIELLDMKIGRSANRNKSEQKDS